MSSTRISTYTTSSDMTTPADITIAPSAGRSVVVHGVSVSAAVNMTFDFVEETSGTVIWSTHLFANHPYVWNPPDGISLETPDKKLQGDAGVAGDVRVTVIYSFG